MRATLGVKGHRPGVGTRDRKHLLYVFALVNVVTAAVHADTLESPKDAKKKTGKSKNARIDGPTAGRRRSGRRAARRFSPDGQTLVTGSADTTALLWRLKARE